MLRIIASPLLLQIFFSLIFSISVFAQPVINTLEAGKVNPGQRASITLKGKGFSKISRLDGIKIDIHEVRVIDDGIPAASDKRMIILVEIPRQIEPGDYPIYFRVSGTDFSNWLMESRIGKANNDPEIKIFFKNRSLKSGSEKIVLFDSTIVGNSVTLKFKISNEGPGQLSLDDLDLPAGFSLDGSLVSTINKYNSAFFYVTLDAETAGIYDGELRLFNNDKNENPFIIKLLGKVMALPAPEISLFFNDSLLSNQDEIEINFGTLALTTDTIQTLKLVNPGNEPLVLTDQEQSGGIFIPESFPVQVMPGDSTLLTFMRDTTLSDSLHAKISFKTNIENQETITLIAHAFYKRPTIPSEADSNFIFATTVSPDTADSTEMGIARKDTLIQSETTSDQQLAESAPTSWWLNNIYYIIIGTGLAFILLFLIAKLNPVILAGSGKFYFLSAIHFETSIDLGRQNIENKTLFDNTLEFKVEPFIDFGKTDLQSKDTLLIDTRKVAAQNKITGSAIDAPAHEGDNLTRIEGIGPVISTLLMESEIRTFEKLSNTKVKLLKDLLYKAKINVADPTTWPKQARLAHDAEWEKLDKLQKQLKGGRIINTKHPK